MHDQPTAAELIAAVRAFLADHARPALTGRTAFHARVAENALAIVERELTLGTDADAREKARLVKLLDAPDNTPLSGLNLQLSEAIRAGTLDERTPGLLAHLKQTTIDQVRVDQPAYSGLTAAIKSDQA
ncbi:MAG: DUF6285 domain-containing protein [Pseudomonadota bacterium]